MAAAARALEAAQAALSRAEQARRQALEAAAAALRPAGPGEPLPDGSLLAASAWLLQETARRQAHWAAERARAEEAAERQRERVVQAHREVRVLELLRERRRLQHRYQVEREERQSLDEVGAVGYVRRRLDRG